MRACSASELLGFEHVAGAEGEGFFHFSLLHLIPMIGFLTFEGMETVYARMFLQEAFDGLIDEAWLFADSKPVKKPVRFTVDKGYFRVTPNDVHLLIDSIETA